VSDYRPIPCEVYDRYERAILHHDRLRLSWRDEAGLAHVETVVPEDLETRAGEEFLLGHCLDGSPRRLRLDRIVEAEAILA
jgi:transcriptional antiterminator Rof (Rho-off)